MKKLLALFAVLALTAPVFAADDDPNVLITIEDEGSGVVRVDYEVLAEDGFDPGAEGNLMRGIALIISTSNTAKIDAISDYDAEYPPDLPAEPNEIPSGYSVYMGSIGFGTDPNTVADFGDPVAPSGDPGAGDDLPNADEIVVEMGSLYGEGQPAPGTSGTLFKLTLDDNGESSTVLNIEGESTRGGGQGEAVLESGGQANITISAEPNAYQVVFDCYIVGNPRGSLGCSGGTITTGNYTAWVNTGKPLSWCCPWQPCGDADGNGTVNSSDYLYIYNNLGLSATVDPSADTNHDGTINSSDYLAIYNHLGLGAGGACPVPPEVP